MTNIQDSLHLKIQANYPDVIYGIFLSQLLNHLVKSPEGVPYTQLSSKHKSVTVLSINSFRPYQ